MCSLPSGDQEDTGLQAEPEVLVETRLQMLEALRLGEEMKGAHLCLVIGPGADFDRGGGGQLGVAGMAVGEGAEPWRDAAGGRRPLGLTVKAAGHHRSI